MGLAGQGRLNFVIPEAIEQRLDVYCDRTGRTPTDVIRQLVSEVLEGDRELSKAAAEHPTGRRTNIPLGYGALARLDEFVREGKHASAAAVIATLLTQFLANRVDMKADEVVIVHVPLPVSVYSALTAQCARNGTPIEKFLAKEAASAANAVHAKSKARRS